MNFDTPTGVPGNALTALPIQDGMVNRQILDESGNQLLPLLITPLHKDVSLSEWMLAHRAEFERDLVHYGGILFRGFDVHTAAAFNDFMKCFDTAPLPYMFRSSPRQELDKSLRNIYRSTSYPSDRRINMHNESSYSRVWGRKIVFCCLQNATAGGETPIADSRRILQDISPELVQKFREKGVKYRRNLFPDLGMPWQEVFQTTDLEAAEDICRKNNIHCSIRDSEQLVIEWLKPAVYKHPDTGADTWFNHVMFFNKYARYEELGMDEDDYLPEDFLTSDTFFGDGTEISYAEYREIKQAYDKNTIVFTYQEGDIIFLDNMLAAHGRNPYQGERTIATAIIEAAYDAADALGRV